MVNFSYFHCMVSNIKDSNILLVKSCDLRHISTLNCKTYGTDVTLIKEMHMIALNRTTIA